MATALTSADKFGRDPIDYSVSHRQPPAPPPVASQTGPLDSTRAAQQSVQRDESGNTPRREDEASSEGRRRGSFSFLRRTTSQQQATSASAPPVPALPATRIAQAAQASARSNALANAAATPPGAPQERGGDSRNVSTSHSNYSSYSSSHNNNNNTNAKPSGEGRTMLRKSSRRAQAQLEQERAQQAAANALPRQPPRLPSHNPLPNIASFGGDDPRPDSVAIFNPSLTRTANFSRGPAAAMPPSSSSSSYNNSSSPAYAVRAGNAFAQAQASSSPAVDGKGVNGQHVSESADRHESMANRGRYSYASSTAPVNVSSPRRVRRRKDPTPFNVLVIGAKNSGKTSFISFLRHSFSLQPHNRATSEQAAKPVNASKSTFESHYLETDMDGERVGLTLWDSAGLEKNIVDLQLREMSTFVESKFEETFVEEQKVMRSPGAKDTHIHCVFLVLDPVRLDRNVAAGSPIQKTSAGLAVADGLDDDMDLQVIRALWGKTTVIPVISKADTLTVGHMAFLKRAVWESLKGAKLDPLEALELEGVEEDDDDDAIEEGDEDEETDGTRKVIDNLTDPSAPKPSKNGTHARQASNSIDPEDGMPYIPMSILSPDPYDLPPYATKSKSALDAKIGRRFAWGLADPYNPEHCDFTRLRDSIFSEWRGDLRDLARTKWYENWRTSRLKNLPGSKQRVRGGVTPVTAVPKEGRMSPPSTRNFSSSSAGQQAAVPRSVSSGTDQVRVATATGERSTSKAERMMGITSAEVGAARGAAHRGGETY